MEMLTPAAFVVVDTENSCQDFVYDAISSSDKVLVLLVAPPKSADPTVPDPFKRPKEVSDSATKRDWVWIVRAASTEKQAVDVMVTLLVSFLVRRVTGSSYPYHPPSSNLSELGKSEGFIFERCYSAAEPSRSHYGASASTLIIRPAASPALILAAGGADSRYQAVILHARMQSVAAPSLFKPENVVWDNSTKLLQFPSRPDGSLLSAKKMLQCLRSAYSGCAYLSLELHTGVSVPCCHWCNMLFDSDSSASSHLSTQHYCCDECKSWFPTIDVRDTHRKPCDVVGHVGSINFCATLLDAHKTACRIQVEERRVAAAAALAAKEAAEEDQKRQVAREIESRTCSACPKPKTFQTTHAKDQHTRSKHK